ncbi:MAG: DUF305 domain-containing protein [Rhodothermales bacterium]
MLLNPISTDDVTLIARFIPLMLLCLTVGCAATLPGGISEAPIPSDSPQTASDQDLAEMEAIFWERQREAMTRYTDAEVDFMTGMIGHHAQALIMSELAPTNGASSSIKTLSARIINAQMDEIATMQRWLENRGEPVPEVHIDGLDLMIHIPGQEHTMGQGHEHSMMPGMLTRAQLEELAVATGSEFDRLYLTYMIQHHEGAIVMVDKMFSTDGAGNDEQAFRLATDINVDQKTEIARMRKMLDAMAEDK